MTTDRDVDDELRALLMRADPWPDPDLDDVLAPLVAREASPGAPQRAPQRVVPLAGRARERWVGAGAVVAALALSAGALASGGWTGEYATGTVDGLVRDADGNVLRTDEGLPYVNAWGTDTSPLVDLGDPGAAAIIAGLAPRDRTLPDWVTWDEIVAAVTPDPGTDPGVTSADGLRMWLLFTAADAWQVSWLEAWTAGDEAAVAVAFDGWSGALEATARSWDPESWQGRERLIEQVRGGDGAAMRYDAEANNHWLRRTGGVGDPRTVDESGAAAGAERS
ncbi:hypothetical protein [Cellulomonas composti]|uniref:Uncharacterized protein n=1 Tax=Cellulomonas composti TaxID=266130 RepID=A0A511J8A7_9CELL|nr:hypothetical protein [Cellulomonas composti]GEL94218.1 hypothetical protein CCO02nite_08760 [Cellulomonas composti]